MPCHVKGKGFADITQISYLFQIGIHLLIGENRQEMAVFPDRSIFLDNPLGDVEQDDIGGYPCFLASGHDPFTSVQFNDVILG